GDDLHVEGRPFLGRYRAGPANHLRPLLVRTGARARARAGADGRLGGDDANLGLGVDVPDAGRDDVGAGRLADLDLPVRPDVAAGGGPRHGFNRDGVPVLVEPLQGKARVLVRPHIDPLRANDEPVEPRRFEELPGVFRLEDDDVLADFDFVLGDGLAEPLQ